MTSEPERAAPERAEPEAHEQGAPRPVQHESRRAIVAAFLANLGIAVIKFVAFIVTHSSSMLSESIHSLADTGNQGLLLLGRARSRRPADAQHPFGYGTVRYFYAFIVAFVLFSLGGVFSVFEGVEKLTHPHRIESAGWAIGVLIGSMVLEGLSFRTGITEANEVRPAGESWWGFIRHTKSPDLPVVLLEDSAALVGLVLALLGVVIADVTGNGRWDGVGSLAIGVLLIAVAVVLVIEMGSLLVGESARPEVVERIRRTIENFPTVRRCIHLRTEHLGPDEIVVATKVEFDLSLTVAELATTIDALEVEIRTAEPRATLIFVEPDVYRESAAPASNSPDSEGTASEGAGVATDRPAD
jgi:cation diffusion facilitator family transporter